MVTTDAIEGTIGSGPNSLWFHYDITSDVLYLRLAAARDAQTVAEESDEGFIILRRVSDDTTVGLTLVNFWQRFGSGARPDSLTHLEKTIEPWADQLAA